MASLDHYAMVDTNRQEAGRRCECDGPQGAPWEHRSCRLVASPTVPTVLRASQHDPFERRRAGLPLRRASQHDRLKEAAVASITLERAGLNLFAFNRSARGIDK